MSGRRRKPTTCTPKPRHPAAPDGVAYLPGFVESVRLLVEREQYTLTDIALMFDVSRERLRQLCGKHHIAYPGYHGAKGMQCQRVWDAATHRFYPVSKGVLNRVARESAKALRKRVSDGYRAHVETALRELAKHQTAPVTLAECWNAVSGDTIPNTHGHLAQELLRTALGLKSPRRQYPSLREALTAFGIVGLKPGQYRRPRHVRRP